MALIGTPTNYNLVDTREDMFITVNTNTENKTKICHRRPPAYMTTKPESSCFI